MNDNGIIAPYLVSSSVTLFRPEYKSQFKLLKDPNSNGMKVFLNTSKPVIPNSSMLNFRDSIKSFEIEGDLLETMTKQGFNVSHSNPQDQNLIHEFGNN